MAHDLPLAGVGSRARGGLSRLVHVTSEHDRVHLMAKVAMNGLGRIGRATLKIVLDTPECEVENP